MAADLEQLVQSMNEQVVSLTNQGAYNQALEIAQLAFGIARDRLGLDHPITGDLLNNIAMLYQRFGDYPSAESLLLKAIEIAEKTAGPTDEVYAIRTMNLAEIYRNQGRYSDAEPLYPQALEIFRSLHGEDHEYVATALNNMGLLYQAKGDLIQAREYLEEARKTFERMGSAENYQFAFTLNNLGEVYRNMGDLATAESLYLRSLELREKFFGVDSSQYAVPLQNMGLLYIKQGRFIEARQAIENAITILQKTLGEEHPDTASALSAFVDLLLTTGEYQQAKERSVKILDIQLKALGDRHPAVAFTLDNLGTAEWFLGDYLQGESHLLQAGGILESALGENSPDLAIHYNELGELYRLVKNDYLAEQNLLKALQISQVGGPSLLFATSANNLGLLYHGRGDFDRAIPLLQAALQIREQILGDDHPDTAQSRDTVFSTLGLLDPARALPLLQKALDVRRKKYGDFHHETAFSLNNLGYFNFLLGNFDTAEELYLKANEARLHSIGSEHPDHSRGLTNLAILYAAEGQITKALKRMIEAVGVQGRLIEKIFTLGSEQQRMNYLQSLQDDFQAYVAFVNHFLRGDSSAVLNLFQAVLQRKGLGAEALATQTASVLRGRYPDLVSELQELAGLQNQVAFFSLNREQADSDSAMKSSLADLITRKEYLEAELARQIPEMNLNQLLRQAEVRAIASILPAGSALVEFLLFQDLDFHALADRSIEPEWSSHYVAFILQSGCPEQVQMVDLGPAKRVEDLLAGWREAITGERMAVQRGENEVGNQPAATLQQAVWEAARKVGSQPEGETPGDGLPEGEALRRAVFDPLQPFLNESSQLFLAPDGDLSRLPFEALPLGSDLFLLDSYQVSYLGVGRDLLRTGDSRPTAPGSPLVIADPDYDRSLGTQPGFQPGLPFTRLSGTLIEGEQVGNLLGVTPWTGEKAVEKTIKEHRSPSIFHLSTHGFFLEDSDDSTSGRSVASGALSFRLAQLQHAPNPLLRSGLALAGANIWMQAGSPPPEVEDGILNGLDITGLDLLDTEMVVLSACETGLGWIQAGEGVHGLRRAFAIAGAKTLVMSLWKVPDQATQELMGRFYTYIVTDKLGRSEALHRAQLELKCQPKYAQPYYWGAFICQGDPGPLPDHTLSNSEAE